MSFYAVDSRLHRYYGQIVKTTNKSTRGKVAKQSGQCRNSYRYFIKYSHNKNEIVKFVSRIDILLASNVYPQIYCAEILPSKYLSEVSKINNIYLCLRYWFITDNHMYFQGRRW